MRLLPLCTVLAASLAAAAGAQTTATIASVPAPVPAPAISTPQAQAAIVTVRDVCLPALKGADLAKAAQAAGFRMSDGGWVLAIKSRQRVELQPPDQANPTICGATITYPPGGGDSIRAAIDAWAKAQSPPLAPVKMNQPQVGALYDRQVSTWSGQSGTLTEGIVLNAEKMANGQPAAGDLGQSILLVSITKA